MDGLIPTSTAIKRCVCGNAVSYCLSYNCKLLIKNGLVIRVVYLHYWFRPNHVVPFQSISVYKNT